MKLKYFVLNQLRWKGSLSSEAIGAWGGETSIKSALWSLGMCIQFKSWADLFRSIHTNALGKVVNPYPFNCWINPATD